jgi:hypothetical protein
MLKPHTKQLQMMLKLDLFDLSQPSNKKKIELDLTKHKISLPNLN